MNKLIALILLLAPVAAAGHVQAAPVAASSITEHVLIHDMRHHDKPADDGMERMTMPPHGDHAMHGTQQGAIDAHGRDPDYSDGIEPSHMPGMDMRDTTLTGLWRFDRLEAFASRDEHGQRWEMAGWYGGDIDRFAWRSEGKRRDHRIDEGDVEALWSHAAAPFWDTELGLRHEVGNGPDRDWLAFGLAGLVPYRFELRATAYLGRRGRSALRLGIGYELRFTRRLILQPGLDTWLHGKRGPARDIDRGHASADLGLRLRYEIRREFAPYLGIAWRHGDGRSGRRWMAGVRFRV